MKPLTSTKSLFFQLAELSPLVRPPTDSNWIENEGYNRNYNISNMINIGNKIDISDGVDKSDGIDNNVSQAD